MTIRAMRAMKVQAKELSKGMYVQSIQGKLDNAFPANGLLIESDEQLTTLMGMCTIATIDLTRSSDTVYQLWCKKEHTMTLVEKPTFSRVLNEHEDHAEYNKPNYNRTVDKYGYQGRFIYRVLEARLVAMTEKNTLDIEALYREISDFVTYTSINPDLLFLESHLSDQSDTLVGIGMRSMIHICNYGKSFNKNDSFLQPIVLCLMTYIASLKNMPSHISQFCFQPDLAENVIFANALLKQLRSLEQQYQFPLSVKKTMLQICERVDGLGPKKLSGTKVTHQSQLINLAFNFEYLQSPKFQSSPVSASEAISTLRAMNNEFFSSMLLDKFVQTLPLFPTGSLVHINNQLAVITQQDPLKKLTPRTLVVANMRGAPLEKAEWISSEVRLGSIRQCFTYKSGDYCSLIREELEMKMPWYSRILNTTRIHAWLQRLDFTG